MTKNVAERFVYFITDGEYVKVGQSVSPSARLSTLQCANARRLHMMYYFDDAIMDYQGETAIHAKLRHLRVRGEWFRHTEEVDELIDALMASAPIDRVQYVGPRADIKADIVGSIERLLGLARMLDVKTI